MPSHNPTFNAIITIAGPVSHQRLYNAGRQHLQPTEATLKCPTCNTVHTSKAPDDGPFWNNRSSEGPADFDARRIFIEAKCPVCLDCFDSVLALPCGHVLCADDYRKLGGWQPPVVGERRANEDAGGHLITVRRAGVGAINGTYLREAGEYSEGAPRYYKISMWKDAEVKFLIHRKRRSNGSMRWHLSANAEGEEIADIYTAQPSASHEESPPESGWKAASLDGLRPTPILSLSAWE